MQNRLVDWYDQAPVELDGEQRGVASGVLAALRGNAAQRAVAAWHMGWPPARQASGSDWLAPYLGHALADPYSCVRYIAQRSLRRLPGFGGFAYDFVGPAEDRSRARETAIGQWMGAMRAGRLDRTGPQILIDESGELDLETLTRLSRRRNDRPVDLRE